MLSGVKTPSLLSPRQSLLTQSRSDSKISFSYISDDGCSNDDYESLRTASTLHSPKHKLSLLEININKHTTKQRKTLKSICKNIKEDEQSIQTLQSKISSLLQQNTFFKNLIQNQQKLSEQKENIPINTLLLQYKIKDLESVVKQQQQRIKNDEQKYQYELNLLYSTINSRLKSKQIECYNTSKMLKQAVGKNNELSQKYRMVVEQNMKYVDTLQYVFAEKQRIKLQKEMAQQKVKNTEFLINRLKICQQHLKNVKQQYFKSQDIIQKITSDVLALKDQNIDLLNQINKKKHDSSSLVLNNQMNKTPINQQLLLKISSLQKQIQYLTLFYKQNQTKLRIQLDNSEQLLQQYNSKIFTQQLFKLNLVLSKKLIH